MKRHLLTAIPLAFTLLFGVACQRPAAKSLKPLKPPEQLTETTSLPANSSPNLKLVIDGVIDQVGKTTGYDASYQKIDYPNGDVPIETGVCSDVIVRAFRNASIDLQKEVHEDMKANFSEYPARWGLSGTDSNIDHRRVPNLKTFFALKGRAMA